MQMATFSTQRKPTQTNRYGKNGEDLSESTLEPVQYLFMSKEIKAKTTI